LQDLGGCRYPEIGQNERFFEFFESFGIDPLACENAFQMFFERLASFL
jgi:hypothetical protein